MLITALGVQNCEQTTTHWLLLPQIKGHISYPALEVTLQLIPEQRTGLPQEHTPFGMAREKPVCISTNLTSMWLFLQQSQKLYKKKNNTEIRADGALLGLELHSVALGQAASLLPSFELPFAAGRMAYTLLVLRATFLGALITLQIENSAHVLCNSIPQTIFEPSSKQSIYVSYNDIHALSHNLLENVHFSDSFLSEAIR